MKQYIRKTEPVEAMCFTGTEACGEKVGKWLDLPCEFAESREGHIALNINTGRYKLCATKGDWIIRDGRKVKICKDEAFKRDYQAHRALFGKKAKK